MIVMNKVCLLIFSLIFVLDSAIAQNTLSIKRQLFDADTSGNYTVYLRYKKYLNKEQEHRLVHYYYSYNNGASTKRAAIYWLHKSANDGNVCAMCNLANCYEMAWGKQRDYKKAMYWYCKAASTRNALAMYYCGFKYYEGWIVKRDFSKGFAIIKKAADLGNMNAMQLCALSYKYGLGTAVDTLRCQYYLQKIGEMNSCKRDLSVFGKFGFDDSLFTFWYPEPYVNNPILTKQIQELVIRLKDDSVSKIVIKAGGNSSYIKQQTSWKNMMFLRDKLMLQLNCSQERFILNYAQDFSSENVIVSFANPLTEGPNNLPPPFPFTSIYINKYFTFCN
jgi:hypothetical protein